MFYKRKYVVFILPSGTKVEQECNFMEIQEGSLVFYNEDIAPNGTYSESSSICKVFAPGRWLEVALIEETKLEADSGYPKSE